MQPRPFTALDKIQADLAVLRAAEFLDTKKNQSLSWPETLPDRTHVANHLESLFGAIHGYVYQDSTASPSPGFVKPEARGALRAAIDGLCTGLFDDSGFARSIDKNTMARLYGEFYHAVMQEKCRPFNYGNSLALRVFLAALDRIDGFNHALDFRFINPDDAEELASPTSIQNCITAFTGCLDLPRAKTFFPPPETLWTVWPNKSVKIRGIRFLEHTVDGKKYIVLANGGLVPLERAKEIITPYKDQGTENPISELRINAAEADGTVNIERYVDETLRHQKTIDGMPVKDGVPFICLGVNPLTGLTQEKHDRLTQYISGFRKLDGAAYSVFDLNIAYNEAYGRKTLALLSESAPNDIKSYLGTAQRRISEIVPIIDDQVKLRFEGKSPVSEHQRKFIMPMGGAGSGKKAAIAFAEHLCGNNYVEASLDASRYFSDVYKVLNAIGHHSDDYVAMDEVAKTIRDWTKKFAIENGYNVLLDGSGNPWTGRYEHDIRNARQHGYETVVCGVHSMLYVPEERKDAFPAPAHVRIEARHNAEGRAMPWKYVLKGHVDSATSLRDAALSGLPDHFYLFDNAGPPGRLNLIAETHPANPEQLHRHCEASRNGKLLDALTAEGLLSASLDDRADLPESLKNSGPPLTEENVAVMPAANNRAIVIRHASAFCDMLQKGQMNKFAAGYEALPEISKGLPFLVPEIDCPFSYPRKPGKLAMHGHGPGWRDRARNGTENGGHSLA